MNRALARFRDGARRLARWPARALLGLFLLLIAGYRRIVSPMTAPCCRFVPTCSSYAAQSLGTHGLLKGGALTCWRLLRCHPFCRGGYDPPPPPSHTDE